MSSIYNENILQYVPFMSFVHPSFWHTLTDIKLDIDKLNESSKKISGKFSFRDDIGPIFEVDGTSFNNIPQQDLYYINVEGEVINKNTIEEFKNIDKGTFLNSVGKTIWEKFSTKTWITNPGSLLHFILLSFADLKKFHYYYWFAFPVPTCPVVNIKGQTKSILTEFNSNQLADLAYSYKMLDFNQKTFFIIIKDNDCFCVKKLDEILDPNIMKQTKFYLDLTDMYFCFADPSDSNNPGWPLRLYMAALLDHCPFLSGSDLQVIGLRCNKNGNIENSLIFSLTIPVNNSCVENTNWVGWERNDRGNFGPKLANMSSSMDPIKLADTSSDLNIKLMKWRLVPNIDVNLMKTTKCLLLGAGTLGCHVARNLLAWGFRHITFIDNGKVSYSNPTRQVLFNYQDCLGGGRSKAEAAAENLKLILPTVKTKGLPMHIPMPGHPVGDSLKDHILTNLNTISEAVKEHDVIFLLLDTREARWLPTLYAAFYEKIVINAALGFDSYLVMRHGVGSSELGAAAINNTYVSGEDLGCYFCNDVTAPGNSLKDRTLDQQCTVTRPGVAAIAGALAVEVLVSLLQHPLRGKAPALCNINTEQDIPEETQGILGPIPHSIRGFLHSYQTVIPTCGKFKQCIACSNKVIDKYRQEGTDFLLKVFDSGKYLEEVTGLTEMHITAELTEILTLSDEDED